MSRRKFSGWIVAFCAATVSVAMGAYIQHQNKQFKTMEQQAAFLLQLTEQAETAFVVIDEQGVVQLWSRGAEQLFGKSRDSVVGYGLRHMMDAGAASKHLAAFNSAVEANEPAGTTYVVGCTYDTPDGPVPIRIESQRVSVHGTNYWTGRINRQEAVKVRGVSLVDRKE